MDWHEANELSVRFTEIGRLVQVVLAIRSRRDYHATGRLDDHVTFTYDVLPR